MLVGKRQQLEGMDCGLRIPNFEILGGREGSGPSSGEGISQAGYYKRTRVLGSAEEIPGGADHGGASSVLWEQVVVDLLETRGGTSSTWLCADRGWPNLRDMQSRDHLLLSVSLTPIHSLRHRLVRSRQYALPVALGFLRF